MKQKFVMIGTLIGVAVLAYIAIAHIQRMQERARFAESGRYSLSSMEDLFIHSDDSALLFDLSLSKAESASEQLRSIAHSPDEIDFVDSIEMHIREASMCREVMTNASIETVRLNEPCFFRAGELEPIYAKELVALKLGDPTRPKK
jgi:hypothetical protein